ncbi:dihydrodipicolinate synthase family protein [Haladaptatus sp. R4]|uniref:dihydrodipicolinate synthase family protein n=1 Tax=Haladaptatus sp. R4 TaxID=1679489 RepID=UPI0007B4A929|nr:dihydrodipicolinate synthase family protein [Haladaptatus sp. R4]KZN22591.1 dihydrodipicolinate synthase family protein [Haladaptatus sp. R4]
MPLSNDEVRQHLRGVAAGILTPFDDNLEVDYEKVKENACCLYDNGIRTFLASANISEYHSLSQDEQIKVTQSSVDVLPSDACILAGVGGSTEEAKDTIRSYDRVGVDAMMIMPPDHSYIHERGLIRYYEKLDAVADAPLVPYVKGFEPSVEYLRDLTNVDGVVGIKYALEDAVKLGMGVEAGADDVVWVNGLAEPFALPFWNEGIEGFSAGVSNFRPEIGLELFEALTAGDWERARRIRNICVPYQNFREETGENNMIAGAISVSAVKKGLDLAGLHGGNVREPIEPLSPADEQKAEELYGQLEDDIERLIVE